MSLLTKDELLPIATDDWKRPVKNLNVLMVYPLPSPVSPQKNCPLSIIYPGRAAEDSGHSVEFWDARHSDEKQLWRWANDADVIAISSLSGFQLGEAMRIAKECKRLYPEKPIIWGGVHVTFQPLPSLRELFVDFVVIGEGEVRFPKLLAAIAAGIGYRNIDGIGYKKSSVGYQPSFEEDEVFGTPNNPLVGVNLRPTTGRMKEFIEIHDTHGGYDDATVFVRERGLTVNLKTQYVSAVSPKTAPLFKAAAKRNEVILQTSRGCSWSPTSCEFCSVAGQFTQKDGKGKVSSVYRYIPYEIWAKDMEAIYAIEPFTFIELEDENSSHFLKDWRYAELLQKLGVTYHLHLRSDQLQDEETIAQLAKTGCVKIHIGAESGNKETLATMRKNEDVEDHYRAAKMLAKNGIEGIYTWIIGNPGETPAQIMDTLRVSDEIKALHPLGKSRATIYVLMPLPGTVAFSRAKKAGWPLPEAMEGWTEMSAAFSPNIPMWMNNVYFIAGFHHNRFHKTPQNFPGWWRFLILPFELMIELRWKNAIRTRSERWFQWYSLEYWCIWKLLRFRSKRSVGQTEGRHTQAPKLLELLIPGLAGH